MGRTTGPVQTPDACDLTGEKTGHLVSTEFVGEMRKVESLRSLYLSFSKAGDLVRETVDMKSAPDYMYLVNEDVAALEDDYLRIQSIYRAAEAEFSP